MGALWGLQFAMLKLAATQGLSEINILTITLVLLSVIFTIILLLQSEMFRITRERVLFLTIIGLLGYIFPLLAALHAAPHISAGILTLIATMAPVVTISIAMLLRTETVTFQRIIAIMLGVLSVLFVLWPQDEFQENGTTYWMIIALILPICYGIESIFIAKYWPSGVTTLQAVTGETLMATAMIVPVFIIYGEPISANSDWSTGALAIAIFVIAGVIESFIYFYLIEKTGGVFVSFGTFIALFAGIAWGIVLFSESHGTSVWVAVFTLCLSLCFAIADRPVPNNLDK